MLTSKDGIMNGLKILINNIICFLAFVFLLGLLALNFGVTTYVEYNMSEKVHIEKQWQFLYLLIALCILGIMYFVIYRNCNKINEIFLYAVFACIYMVAGIYLICNIDGILRDDALSIHNAAKMFAGDDFSDLLQGGYIFRKPHQLGMVTYERIVGLLSFDEKLLFFINLLIVNGINYLCYKLSDLFFEHNKEVNCLAITFSYLFLPQFFYIAFAYGLIVGFFFLMLAIYYLERYFRFEKKKELILAAIFVCVAVILKSNYLIGAIAIGLCCLKKFVEKQKGILVLSAILLVMLPVGVQKVIPFFYQWESGIEVNEGEPMLSYIAMGINPMNESLGPGWYDGSNWNWYEDTGFDKQAATEKAQACIQNCFLIYREKPMESIRFFIRKIASMWCDPMFQSVWSGPLEDTGQKTHTKLLASIYNGEQGEKIICNFMKAYMIVLFSCAAVYILDKNKKEFALESTYSYFIGGFLFHIIWEAKSQYVYTYAFVLIPACAYVVHLLFLKAKGLRKI